MTADLPERCRRIATATWSDALDQLGVRGVMDGIAWRCGADRIAGPAVTVREEVAEVGAYALEAFDVGSFLGSAGAGDVIVVDMGGAAVSTFGGLAARAARAKGIAAIVVDGGCRDVEEIRGTGMWLASRHLTPRSGKRRLRVAAIGGAVRCGGVEVRQGDWIVADETGVIAVPGGRIEEALALAEALAANDRRFEAAIDAGSTFARVAADLKHV